MKALAVEIKTLGLEGTRCLSPGPSRFTPGKNTGCYYCWGYVDPGVALDWNGGVLSSTRQR
jgi:hypothetical protein